MRYLLVLLLLLPAYSTLAAGDEPFRVRLTEDLGTLDWNYGEVNPEIAYQLMEGLFKADAKGRPVHGAAKSHFWNKDKTSLRILLDPASRWSDGSPVCAQAFVDSWTRLLSKEFASPYAHYGHILKKFEATSCRELKIEFTRPSPEAPALFSHYVFFPLRAEQLKKEPGIFRSGKGLLVNGAFRVTDWKRGQKLVMEPNPNYGGAKPYLSAVEFLFIPDDGTAQVLFEQKKLDWMRDIPPLLRGAALEKSGEFRQFPSLTAYYLGVNATRSTLAQDPAVRRGLSEALDRSEFTKVLGREHKGTRTWLLPALFPALKSPAPNKEAIALGAEKMKAALAAGKMDLVLRVYDKSAHRLLAEWLQGQWEKKLGVRIPIEVQESKVYWKDVVRSPAPIFLSGVTAPYAHPRSFLQEFLTSSTANWTGWSSAAYDEAVTKEKFQEAEELLREGGHVIPLYERDSVALVQKKWKSFFINPLGQVFLSELKAP